jgi:hypothetical protein
MQYELGLFSESSLKDIEIVKYDEICWIRREYRQISNIHDWLSSLFMSKIAQN